jgi:hypothetical protein
VSLLAQSRRITLVESRERNHARLRASTARGRRGT